MRQRKDDSQCMVGALVNRLVISIWGLNPPEASRTLDCVELSIFPSKDLDLELLLGILDNSALLACPVCLRP